MGHSLLALEAVVASVVDAHRKGGGYRKETRCVRAPCVRNQTKARFIQFTVGRVCVRRAGLRASRGACDPPRTGGRNRPVVC